MMMAGQDVRGSVQVDEAARGSVVPNLIGMSDATSAGAGPVPVDTSLRPHNCESEITVAMSDDEGDNPTPEEHSAVKRRRQDEEQFQKMLHARQLGFLAKKTHFTLDEIKSLNTIFSQITNLARNPGKMDRHTFRKSFAELFGVTNSMMLDHTFNYFDIDNDGQITFSEWVVNLSVLLRGSFEEQIEYCYRVYDLDGDESITRTEVMSLVQGSMLNIANVQADDEDGDRVTELTDMLMKKLDTKNGNGLIPLHKFRRAVRQDPLLVQCLGPCLAEPRKVEAFLSTITENYLSFSTNYTKPPEKGCRDPQHAEHLHHRQGQDLAARNKEKRKNTFGTKESKQPKLLTTRYSVATITNAKDDGRNWNRHALNCQRKRESLQQSHAPRVVHFLT